MSVGSCVLPGQELRFWFAFVGARALWLSVSCSFSFFLFFCVRFCERLRRLPSVAASGKCVFEFRATAAGFQLHSGRSSPLQ